MTLQFGMFDQTEQPGGLSTTELYQSRLTMAETAEQAGFWGYHKSEHHLTPLDHAPSIGLFLSALAQRTKTMRLCSLCHLLPFYHPLRLYEEICMLDHLSNGRFEFGFGKGISEPEHRLWGMQPDEAVERTEETLQLLLAAFQSDGNFSFRGKFHEFVDIPLQIKPFQTPYPPLWRPGRLEIAAAMGVSTMVGGPAQGVNDSIVRYKETRQAGEVGVNAGRKPKIGAIRKFVVAPTDDAARKIARRAWSTYSANLGNLFNKYKLPIPNDPTIGGDFDRAESVEAIAVGSPARIRDYVEALTEPGNVQYIVGCFAFGDLSHTEAMQSLELFGEHVVAPLANSKPEKE